MLREYYVHIKNNWKPIHEVFFVSIGISADARFGKNVEQILRPRILSRSYSIYIVKPFLFSYWLKMKFPLSQFSINASYFI